MPPCLSTRRRARKLVADHGHGAVGNQGDGATAVGRLGRNGEHAGKHNLLLTKPCLVPLIPLSRRFHIRGNAGVRFFVEAWAQTVFLEQLKSERSYTNFVLELVQYNNEIQIKNPSQPLTLEAFELDFNHESREGGKELG